MTTPIRVAIVGGSIAGCTLANGLIQYPHITFDVYDAKSSFGERGIGIDLAINAQRSLEIIGLDAQQMFRNTGAVQGEEEPYSIVAYGKNRGKRLYQTPPGSRRNVMRTRWLSELIKNLPAERLHSNKTLATITEPAAIDKPYVLHFTDGSTDEADAVIGCDGIRSKVRDIILGSDNSGPIFSGYWDTRATTTPEKAARYLGKDVFDPERRQSMAMTGEGSFMLFSPSDDGKTLGVIMSAKTKPGFDGSKWKTPLSRDFLEQYFTGWDEQFRDGVIDCLLEDPKGPGVVFSQWHSAPAPNYHRGRICMMGDAAHAIVPYMGQGANMAMEDAAVMSALLGSIRSRSELVAAMRAFDETRRGRREQIGLYSHEMAKLATGQVTLNPSEVVRTEFKTWWEYAYQIDMKAHVEQAIARMRLQESTT